MPFYKSNLPDVSSVALHGKEFDVVNGFVEIDDADITPEIETTLTKHMGFTLATDAEVDTTIASLEIDDATKRSTDERKDLIAEMKAWGIHVDGRKNLAWVRERYSEAVESGAIKPGAEPPEAKNDEADEQPEAKEDDEPEA
jgi:hypothetical protein